MNRISIALGALIAVTSAFASAKDWSGYYTSTIQMGTFTHVENNIVVGNSAKGIHTFTDGYTFGSFEWAGTLVEDPLEEDHVIISGAGFIHNLGERPMVAFSGEIWLHDDGTKDLFWMATDPQSSLIGSGSHWSSAVPEPGIFGIALAGGLIALATAKRRTKTTT